MIITIVNRSELPDSDVLNAIRAINRQIKEDFEPYWSLGATLRLEGRHPGSPDKVHLPELRGDAVIYLWDQVNMPDALGYHDANARGIPYGFVFTELAADQHQDWTVPLSHEALELIADPLSNLLVAGPHPHEHRKVFYWYEMSDPVSGDVYEIDGVKVQNFVLPLYFSTDAPKGCRSDFMGAAHGGQRLQPFGINPGGYLGYFDPKIGKHVTVAHTGDKKARARHAAKKKHDAGRRAVRMAELPAHLERSAADYEVLE